MAGADDDLELLDVAPRTVTTQTSVSSGTSRRNQILAGLGVLVAGVVIWSITAGSGSESAESVPEEAPVEQTGEDESAEAVDDVEDNVDDAGVEDAATTENEPLVAGSALDPIDPVLSQSGLTLYAQRLSGAATGMIGVDLDEGTVTNYGYPFDEILLQSDEYLIVRALETDRHSAISLSVPEETPRVISKNTWIVAAREEGGEQVVAFLAAVESEGSVRYTEMTIDLDIGTIVFRGTLRDTHPFLPNNRLSTNTGLFTGPTGGVYEVRGPTYEQVTDGRILGFDDNFAIVERCDDALICDVSWVQRTQDWATVDRPLPPDEFEHALILGGGRILVVREQFGSPRIFDVEADDFLDVGPIESIEAIAVSPDGDVIALAGIDGVTLIDVETGTPIGSPIADLAGPVSLAITP